jgi:hypothetical protein
LVNHAAVVHFAAVRFMMDSLVIRRAFAERVLDVSVVLMGHDAMLSCKGILKPLIRLFLPVIVA